MDRHDSATEKDIIRAAREVFTSKGYKGATIRDIAARAGVNPAMVNYYFRSKERLFRMIFDDAFHTLFSKMREPVFGEGSLFEKIEMITDAYFETITENPSLPTFVLSELAHNSAIVVQTIGNRHEILQIIDILGADIDKAVSGGLIRKIEPLELCLNIISLVVFPVAINPIIDHLAQKTKIDSASIFANRSLSISQFVISAIKI